MALLFRDQIDSSRIAFGVVLAQGLVVDRGPPPLEAALTELALRRAREPLSTAEEARRRAAREMLRHGAFRPTGRAKPASEYLLRAATEGQVPRINGPVDAANLVSLATMIPISLWDVEASGSHGVALRRGDAGERFVFNVAGQELELQDLVCGVALDGARGRPIVTPVKDSLATKLTPASRHVAGLIYYPLEAGDETHLAELVHELGRWLGACGDGVGVRRGVLAPGGELTL